MAYFLGGGIMVGALVRYALGPGRGSAFLGWFVSRAALVPLVALLSAFFAPSELLAFAARASLATVLGLFSGGLTQTLAMGLSGSDSGEHERKRALALVFILWALVLALAASLTPGQ